MKNEDVKALSILVSKGETGQTVGDTLVSMVENNSNFDKSVVLDHEN